MFSTGGGEKGGGGRQHAFGKNKSQTKKTENQNETHNMLFIPKPSATATKCGNNNVIVEEMGWIAIKQKQNKLNAQHMQVSPLHKQQFTQCQSN